MESLAVPLVVSIALIALNGWFVLAEFALVRVRASRVELLARQGNPKAVMVQDMLKNLDFYLSACQMGITMTSLGLGWIGEPAVARFLAGLLNRVPAFYGTMASHVLSFALAFGVITFVHILLGELVPRSIGIQKAELVSLWITLPLRAFSAAFRGPIGLLARTSIAILRAMGIPPAAEAEAHLTEEEMRILLGTFEEKAGFSLERLMLIENIFDFGAAKVADAMVPKDKIAFLSLEKAWEENLAVIRSRRLSRYVLCRKGLDTAVGYVHVKDLLLSGGAPPDLAALRRDFVAVAPGDSLQKLLQALADRGVHLAVVRGEGSEPAGIVTLEDVVEELVGEIHDEFDLPAAWSLMDVLVRQAVEVGIEAADRQTVLRRLVDRLKAAVPELDAAEAMRLVWERETKLSSAVGHGVAIPHGRLPGLQKPLLAVGRAAKPLPFPSPYRVPVRLVFLVLTPAGAPLAQLRILARVASLLSNDNLRRRILRAKTADALVEILRTADTVVAT